MGFSFGYNQNEDIQDHNSLKTLVLTLVNIVSTGGNLNADYYTRGGIHLRPKGYEAWLDGTIKQL
jgi:hypothetical protein